MLLKCIMYNIKNLTSINTTKINNKNLRLRKNNLEIKFLKMFILLILLLFPPTAACTQPQHLSVVFLVHPRAVSPAGRSSFCSTSVSLRETAPEDLLLFAFLMEEVFVAVLPGSLQWARSGCRHFKQLQHR